MSKKLFLLVVCLVQGLYGNEIDDVIEELMPQIQNARENLKFFADQITDLLDKARFFEVELINAVNTKLDNQLKIAEREVDQIKEAAAAIGKNITVCLDKYRDDVKHIDRSKLSNCSSSELFTFEHAKIREINDMRMGLASVPFSCSTGQTDPDIVRSCILSSIELTKSQILYINSEATQRISEAHSEARTCTIKQEALLLDTAQSILTDFKVCVTAI